MAWTQLELSSDSCFETKKKLITRLAGYKLEDALDFAGWLSAVAKEIVGSWSKSQEKTSKSDITRRVQRGLITMVIAAISDAMKINAASGAILTNSSQIGEIEALAKKIPAEKCTEMIAKAYEVIRWIDASVNEKLIFEQLLLNFVS